MLTTEKCKVTIFLEKHYDQVPPLTLNGALPFFKSQGYNTLCIESKESNKEKLIREFKESLSDFQSAFCPEYLTSTSRNTLIEAKKKCHDNANNFAAKLQLLNSLKDGDIKYCGMDTGHKNTDSDIEALFMASAREPYMVQNIQDSRKDGNVLVLVGAVHYEGARGGLVEQGIENVRGYYIPSDTPPEPRPEFHENGARLHYAFDKFGTLERQLRAEELPAYTENKNLNLVVFDQFKDPNPDVTTLVQQDYLYYLAGAAAQGEGEL